MNGQTTKIRLAHVCFRHWKRRRKHADRPLQRGQRTPHRANHSPDRGSHRPEIKRCGAPAFFMQCLMNSLDSYRRCQTHSPPQGVGSAPLDTTDVRFRSPTKGFSVLHPHGITHIPSPLPGVPLWCVHRAPYRSGLPRNFGRPPPTSLFFRPAQHSRGVSTYALAETLTDLFVLDCFAHLVNCKTVPTATGWNIPCRAGFEPIGACSCAGPTKHSRLWSRPTTPSTRAYIAAGYAADICKNPVNGLEIEWIQRQASICRKRNQLG